MNLVIEYDVNGNGKLDFDEFMEMMKKQAHTAHCTPHTAHCTLHTAHCTIHTAY